VLIVVLYTENDLEDLTENIWRETDARGAPTKIMTTRMYMDHNGRLLHTPEALQEFLPWNFRIPVLRRSHVFTAVTNILNRGSATPSLTDRMESELADRSELWGRFILCIRSIGEWARERDVEVLFVTIPAVPKQRKGTTLHERIVHAIEVTLNLPLVDLLPFLSTDEYFDHDLHFNPEGHALAAAKILEHLDVDRPR